MDQPHPLLETAEKAGKLLGDMLTGYARLDAVGAARLHQVIAFTLDAVPEIDKAAIKLRTFHDHDDPTDAVDCGICRALLILDALLARHREPGATPPRGEPQP